MSRTPLPNFTGSKPSSWSASLIPSTHTNSCRPDIIYHRLGQTNPRRGRFYRLVKRPLRPRLLGHRLSVRLDLEIIVLEIGPCWDDRPDSPQGLVGRVLARIHGYGLGGIEIPQLGNGAVQKNVLAEDGLFEQVERYRNSRRRWTRLLGNGGRISACCRGRGAGGGDSVGCRLTPWNCIPSAAIGCSQKGGI